MVKKYFFQPKNDRCPIRNAYISFVSAPPDQPLNSYLSFSFFLSYAKPKISGTAKGKERHKEEEGEFRFPLSLFSPNAVHAAIFMIRRTGRKTKACPTPYLFHLGAVGKHWASFSPFLSLWGRRSAERKTKVWLDFLFSPTPLVCVCVTRSSSPDPVSLGRHKTRNLISLIAVPRTRRRKFLLCSQPKVCFQIDGVVWESKGVLRG